MTGRKRGNGRANEGGMQRISSFFHPVARPQTACGSQASNVLTSTSSTASSPLPSTPSTPSTPCTRKAARTPPKPTKSEIGASDEDASLSDDSLEDLSRLLGGSRSTASVQQKYSDNPWATPKAKRTATDFHSSPLAIIPRHKFDLKTLAKDARCDDATTASSLRVKSAAVHAVQNTEEHDAPRVSASEDAIAEIVKEKGGPGAQKVLRAVQRSESSQSQARYLFFEPIYEAPPTPAAPKLAKNSPWSLLTQGSAISREQYLTSGLPQTILRQSRGLPDSLFEWMLDSLSSQSSIIIRLEHCNMIASCSEQIERILTPDRLCGLFVRLGARTEDHEAQVGNADPDSEPYKSRDWASLLSFVSLLGRIARQLSVESVEYAARTMVRMALDKIVLRNLELLAEFEFAIEQLLAAIPRSSWDAFCVKMCSLLGEKVKSRNIKVNALMCLPVSTKQTHDLRRRIAVSTLFNDENRACRASEEVISLRDMIDCVSGDDFAISPRTNFAELRSNIILLDISVDDGSIVEFDEDEDEKKFNNDVDELSGKLREIWRKTNDAGMKIARTEVKSVAERVEQRLSHSVRTRRRARKSVFDIPGQEDPFMPRQRDFMSKFLQKKSKARLAEEAAAPEEESPQPFEIDEDTIVVASG